MTFKLDKQSDASIDITATISWSDIKVEYDTIFATLLKEIEVPGFRKGMAPKNLAEAKIDKTRVYEEVLKKFVPKVYSQAVTELKITPIISPKVEVRQAEENKDWVIIIRTCEKPPIKLGDYRGAISQLKKNYPPQIWTPGEKPTDGKKSEPAVGEILDAIYNISAVTLPEILVDQETNRLLSNTYNELQKLGLTVEQYLDSQGKTSELLKHEYQEQAKKTLTLEFALEVIADSENTSVSNAEIDEVIKKAKTDNERKALENERYYLAGLLRRQKTLTELLKPTLVRT